MDRAFLIHGHLNGALLREETATLDTLLAREPAVAEQLAELSRIDAALARHYGGTRPAAETVALLIPDKSRNPALVRRLVIATAVVGVLALGGVRLWKSFHPAADRANARAAGPAAMPRPQTGFSSNGSPAAARGLPDAESPDLRPAADRWKALLAAYYLPGVRFDRTPLDKALDELETSIRDVNHSRRPVLEALRLRLIPVAGDAPGGAQPAVPRVTLDTQNASAFAILGALAAQAGAKIEWRDESIDLLLRPTPPDSGPIVSKSYRVPPDILRSAGGTAFEPAPQRTVAEVLNEFGIDFPPGTGASFDPQSGRLTVNHTEPTHRWLEALTEGLLAPPRFNIHIESRLLEMPVDSPLTDQVLDAAAIEKWMADLDDSGAGNFKSLPSVTAANGQPATVEVIKEGPTDPSDWAGTRVLITPTAEGEFTHLVGSIDVRGERAAGAPRPARPDGAPAEGGDDPAVDFEAIVDSDQVAVVKLGERDSRQIIAVVRARRVAPSGEPLPPPTDEPEAVPDR